MVDVRRGQWAGYCATDPAPAPSADAAQGAALPLPVANMSSASCSARAAWAAASRSVREEFVADQRTRLGQTTRHVLNFRSCLPKSKP
jgi:hypothetical protein